MHESVMLSYPILLHARTSARFLQAFNRPTPGGCWHYFLSPNLLTTSGRHLGVNHPAIVGYSKHKSRTCEEGEYWPNTRTLMYAQTSPCQGEAPHFSWSAAACIHARTMCVQSLHDSTPHPAFSVYGLAWRPWAGVWGA